MTNVRCDLPSDAMLAVALRAITQMGHEYSSEWTDTWRPPWFTHEYIYTAAIGRALKTSVPGCVRVESYMRDVVKNAKNVAECQETDNIFKSKRIDISVLRSYDARPVFCIEVKNNGYKHKEKIREDVDRCKKILKHTTSAKNVLKEMAVIFLLAEGKSNNIKNAFNKRESKKNWAEDEVVGLDKHGNLICKYEELDIQEYFYNEASPQKRWDRGDMEIKDKWAALAVRIKRPTHGR